MLDKKLRSRYKNNNIIFIKFQGYRERTKHIFFVSIRRRKEIFLGLDREERYKTIFQSNSENSDESDGSRDA